MYHNDIKLITNIQLNHIGWRFKKSKTWISHHFKLLKFFAITHTFQNSLTKADPNHQLLLPFFRFFIYFLCNIFVCFLMTLNWIRRCFAHSNSDLKWKSQFSASGKHALLKFNKFKSLRNNLNNIVTSFVFVYQQTPLLSFVKESVLWDAVFCDAELNLIKSN